MTPVEQMIAAVLCSSGLMELIKYLIGRHDKKNNCEDELKKAIEEMRENISELAEEAANQKQDTIVMMHDRIYQALVYFEGKESLTVTDRANIDYLAERYFARGGNHKAELMYDIICKIPVVDNGEGDVF